MWQNSRKQAVRLGGRHNMPPPHLDFWPFDFEVGVGVACDLGTPVQTFVFLGLLVFELEPMYATSDRQTDDGRRWPLNAPAAPTGRGHNKLYPMEMNGRWLEFISNLLSLVKVGTELWVLLLKFLLLNVIFVGRQLDFQTLVLLLTTSHFDLQSIT